MRLQNYGDVAQLARALDWQSRGRGFESHLLHKGLKPINIGVSRCEAPFLLVLITFIYQKQRSLIFNDLHLLII